MKRAPEQEAARRALRKCQCGNVAGLNKTHCRTCREGMEAVAEESAREREAVAGAVAATDEMEALKARVASGDDMQSVFQFTYDDSAFF